MLIEKMNEVDKVDYAWLEGFCGDHTDEVWDWHKDRMNEFKKEVMIALNQTCEDFMNVFDAY